MLENRFSEFWDAPELIPGSGSTAAIGAFVLCPCAVLQSMAMPQYLLMEQVYRLAYTQAQAQLSESTRRTRFDFSVN